MGESFKGAGELGLSVLAERLRKMEGARLQIAPLLRREGVNTVHKVRFW